MRMHALTALALASLAGGAPTVGMTAGQGHFTPDEAALACMARAEREVARRYGAPARPAGRLETDRLDGRWQIHGEYVVGEGERLRVSCEVSADQVSLEIRPVDE